MIRNLTEIVLQTCNFTEFRVSSLDSGHKPKILVVLKCRKYFYHTKLFSSKFWLKRNFENLFAKDSFYRVSLNIFYFF